MSCRQQRAAAVKSTLPLLEQLRRKQERRSRAFTNVRQFLSYVATTIWSTSHINLLRVGEVPEGLHMAKQERLRFKKKKKMLTDDGVSDLVHHSCSASPQEAAKLVARLPVDGDGLPVKAIDLPVQRFHPLASLHRLSPAISPIPAFSVRPFFPVKSCHVFPVGLIARADAWAASFLRY